MKQHILFVILLLAVQVCIAQPMIVKNDATQVLYIGADNPVTVRVDHYKPAELTVKVSTGNISKTSTAAKYKWTICDSNDSLAKIKIYCGKQFIKELSFLLLRLGEPAVTISPHRSRYWDWKSIKGLMGTFENMLDIGVSCKIINFNVSYFSKGKVKDLGNEGAHFTPDVRNIIDHFGAGDTLIFDRILYRVGCEPMFRQYIGTLGDGKMEYRRY